MKRFPAYDPPEYVDWTPEPELVRDFRTRLEDDPERLSCIAALDREGHLSLYRDLLRTRLHDIFLKRWVRQGIISKAWLGTGEEAVTVGAVSALEPGRDVVIPMIRNAGACHMMGMPLSDMFRGYLATADGPNGGRDLHIGDPEKGVIQPISHMGTNATVITGVALGFRQRSRNRVALTWIGDGAIRTAACHEAVNFAAVQELPAVFVLQNNQVALGTRLEQHGAGSLSAWPDQYGIPARRCDGNNVLDVYAATRLAVERCRRGEGPAAVVAETFRMGGHATHDEREARETFPDELFREWGRRDPVGLYEAHLTERKVDGDLLERIEKEVHSEMEDAAEAALASRDHALPPQRAIYEGFTEGSTTISVHNRPI